MKVYTMQDIERKMAEIVMQYIGEGYIFNTKEMRVMYSDKTGFVKLYNENAEENRKHIMVYISAEEKTDDTDIAYVDLVIEESNKPYDTYKAIVNKKEIRYYSLNFGRWYFNRPEKLVYTMDGELSAFAEKIRTDRRWDNLYEVGADRLNCFDADKIIKIVNKTNGYKSCRKSQIKSVCLTRDDMGRVISYNIYLDGKKYPVCKNIER